MIKLFCFDFLTHPLGIISEFWCLATETFEFTVLYNNIYRKKVCDNFAWSKISHGVKLLKILELICRKLQLFR